MNTRNIVMAALPLFIFCAITLQAQTEWTQVPIPTNHGQVELHPRDSLRCFLLTEDTGYYTTDGGAKWQPVLQIRSGNRLLHINPDGAGVLFSAGVLYRTTDHGGGWDSVTVGIDTLLTAEADVEGIASVEPDRLFFLLGGSAYESDASASALQQVNVPLLELQTLTVASASTWALSSAEAVAITADGGATWHTRSTEGPAGPANVLTLSPNGSSILGFDDWPEQVDPTYTFDGGATWRGIDWPDEAEQIAWPRIPGYPFEKQFRDVAAHAPDAGDALFLTYPLGESETAMLYELQADSPARFLGRIPRVDALTRTSTDWAWGCRQGSLYVEKATVWRVRDMREDLPTLRARDVSTDLRPAAHVAVREGRAASWTAVRVERSAADSTWRFVDSLRFPHRSLIDTTVATGGAYRYRASFRLTDGSASTAHSDAISAQPGSVIDMRDFLLPPAHTDLHYVDSLFHQPSNSFVAMLTLTYEYLETRTHPPFEIEHAYRKILQEFTGESDTSYAAIIELASDPPTILVRDSTADGWQPLARRDSSTGWYYQKTLRLADGSYWLNERFITPSAASIDDEQQLRLLMEEHFPASNYQGSRVYGRRGVGIVGSYNDFHILQARGSSTLILESVTDIARVDDPVDFHISSAWPQPAGAVMQIAVELDAPRTLRLTLHDMLGREVAQLAEGWYDAGRRVFRFDAGALPRGLYFLRAASGEHIRVRKLLLR